jgi:NAD(P)-dependent dehydrogenase (short-subunit alcohol dehydrogenase family)
MDAEQRQVVVITGASAGVGRATAREFAKRGAAIGLIARGPARLEAARREVEDLGGRAVAVSADVANNEQLESAADRFEAELGPIDLWVNNAMTSVFAPVWEVTPDEFLRVTQVTYLGGVNGTLAALKRMKPRDQGTILQVGSALAFRGIPLQAAYCGSKHALQGFTESLRSELIHEGSNVKVKSVHLPAVNTPQFQWVRSKLPYQPQPVPPIFQPEVPARAIVWLAEHDDTNLYVAWPTLATVWSNRVAPRLMDVYLGKTGFSSQQTEEPASANQPDNLFAPVDGDYAAHGRFDDRARAGSPLLYWMTRGKPLALGAIAIGSLGAALGLWKAIGR